MVANLFRSAIAWDASLLTHLGGLPTTSCCATASSSRAMTRQVFARPIVASGFPTSCKNCCLAHETTCRRSNTNVKGESC